MTAIRKRMINRGKQLGHKPQGLDKIIKRWLKSDSKGCPWVHIDGNCLDINLCRIMFPRLQKGRNHLWGGFTYGCPCSQYSTNYVVRRAKEALK